MNAQFLFCVLFFFVCGTLSGSFFNCMAMRIVRGKDWTRGRSECPYCGHVLKASDLIPLFSYLFLKGRCRYCHAKISLRYPVSEAVSGCFYVLFFLKDGFSVDLFFELVLFSVFFALSLVDMDSYLIPDRFIILGILNRFVLRCFRKEPLLFLKDLAGGLSVAILLYLIASLVSYLHQRESFGGGDIKLIFMIVLYTGIYEGAYALLYASLLGLLFMRIKKKEMIAFGPFLCLGALMVFFLR